MIRVSCKALSGVLLFFLVGCAVKPVVDVSERERQRIWADKQALLETIDAWHLKGRLAVNNAQDSWSASLIWRESTQDQEVRVVAPLGQGTAVVKREGHGMTQLKLSNGRVFFGESASDLLHAQLGWYLPVESLVYWVRGMPDPDYASQWRLNELGQIDSLEQAGWQVEYKRYRFSDHYEMELPSKLFLQRDDWRIKLVVQDWQGYKNKHEGKHHH